MAHTEKFLSLILRHKPEIIGIVLDSAGWTDILKLLDAIRRSKPEYSMSLNDLFDIVNSSEKKRFEVRETVNRMEIRACQGHSVPVDLELKPVAPPSVLFHGTSEQNVIPIKTDGIKAGKRHAVHLSEDVETAIKVGLRRGKSVVFKIESGVMRFDGYIFYRSTNGVWLTEYVPPAYIDVVEGIERLLKLPLDK